MVRRRVDGVSRSPVRSGSHHLLALTNSVSPGSPIYAATAVGAGVSLNASPRVRTAQAMRAVLLANATATSLNGFLASMAVAQFRGAELRILGWRNTAVAPVTNRLRRYRSPIFDIRPSRSFPPLDDCRGTRPRKAANSRPDLNMDGSVTLATIAVAVIGPMPGMVARRLLAGLARCHLSSS